MKIIFLPPSPHPFPLRPFSIHSLIHLAKLNKVRPNLSVLKEYQIKLNEYLSRAQELEAFTKTREETKKKNEILRKQRLDEFMKGFSFISHKLKEIYQVQEVFEKFHYSSLSFLISFYYIKLTQFIHLSSPLFTFLR